MSKQKSIHDYYIKKAIDLTAKAFDVRPNPYVGALLVKNNKVIASGFHKKAGLKHAEIYCLDKVGSRAKGATLYVTLEPCSSFGRTSPCVDRIIKSGIKEVIIGTKDPNPQNRGYGIKLLRRAGIKVRVGFLKKELNKLNTVFIKYVTKHMPYVCIKVAQSLDGKIATDNFDSKWITGSLSRRFSHKYRSNFDAIMVGINTVLKDNPQLCGTSKNLKIIIDTHLKVSPRAKLFNKGKVIIACSDKVSTKKTLALIKKKAIIIETKTKNGKVDLKIMMRKLALLEISKILVEGGGELIGSLFDNKLVDKIMFFIAPKIIGGRFAVSSVMGKGVRRVNQVVSLSNISLKRIGRDFLFEGTV